MKTLIIPVFWVTVLMCWTMTFAQEAPVEDRHTIYQVYIGEFDASKDMRSQLYELRKLGFVRNYSIVNEWEENMKADEQQRRIYLGPYLGRATAEAILIKAWQMGYADAAIEQNEDKLRKTENADLIYSIQLGAFEDPDLRNFEEIASLPAHGLHLMYEEGHFKVLSGMYHPDQVGYLKRTVIPYLRDLGFYGFIRTFREPYRILAIDTVDDD